MEHELPDGFTKDIVGYCDPLSVSQAQQVDFKLGAWGSAIGAIPTASIVRLSSGDTRPQGTGMIESHVADLEMPALEHQPLVPGSYGLVSHAALAELKANNSQPCDLEAGVARLSLSFYPTLAKPERQTLLSWGSLRISIDDQGVYATGSTSEVALTVTLRARRWYDLSLDLGLGAKAQLSLTQHPLGVAEQAQQWVTDGHDLGPFGDTDLYFACQHPGSEHFNGRLEAPLMQDQAGKVLARWDFSRELETQQFLSVEGAPCRGTFFQNPTRCVKGKNWDGSVQSYLDEPSHYGAVHFHEDDLTNAGWRDSVSWSVPNDLDSGVYALKVSVNESEDYVPFFVKAKREARRKFALLIPTASYLAYANQRIGFSDGVLGSSHLRDDNSAFLYAHKDVGYSMYEHHRDGSGVHYSSRLRPVINMKPKNPTWAFNADTHLTAWLDAIEQEFDVVTDEDLHLEGSNALAGYRVVMTGTHPEYYSSAMRDGLEAWMAAGGRLMYMGGNGFYWRVAFQPDNPAIMEVRRAEDGTRAWIANPGEYYQQFDGAYGGLWRRQGKPPNQLVGIGFAAQGFDGGTHYRLQADALDPRVAFVMDGVTATDTIGQYGNQGGGAAGEEIDRWDAELGSPAHALIIASSENHRPGMLRVKEEFHMTEPQGNDPKVRADMVFYELPGGGAVFSTGSISYAGSLAHADYQNDIARLTGNVLRRFLDATPFELPGSLTNKIDTDETIRV